MNRLEKLRELLLERFPNELPTEQISENELSKLIGNQEVIKYIEEYINRLTNKED